MAERTSLLDQPTHFRKTVSTNLGKRLVSRRRLSHECGVSFAYRTVKMGMMWCPSTGTSLYSVDDMNGSERCIALVMGMVTLGHGMSFRSFWAGTLTMTYLANR